MRCYLDIDGVMVPNLGADSMHWGDWSGGLSPSSKRMGAALAGLGLDLVWVSTWQHEANERLAPRLGWEPLPTLERRAELLWWKLEAICRAHPLGEPLVWIDDEIEERDEELAGMVRECVRGVSSWFLLISPDGSQGLSPGEIQSVKSFLTQTG